MVCCTVTAVHDGLAGARDGLLLVRLVSKNVGELTAAELLCALWNRHGASLHVDAPPGGGTGRRRKQLATAHHDVSKTPRTPRLASAANQDDASVRTPTTRTP